jgi:hypothetical protein
MHDSDIRPPRRTIVHPSLTPAPGSRVLLAELDAWRPGIHLTAAARSSAGVVAMAPAFPLALSGPSLASARNPISAPPGRAVPTSDRSGLWLRNAAGGLCVLAAAAAAVSFTAQFRMVDATRHLPLVAALEASIPDAAALVFACLGIALALHGRHALRARALNLASVGASVFMNAIAAAPGWRNLAIWAMPPIAYALASDTLIAVVRASVIARHQHLGTALAGDTATPPAILGGLILWLLRLAPAPASTLAGFRAWVLTECPTAPGRRAPAPAALPPQMARVQGETKTSRFLSLATERHGPLASIPLDRVAQISAALASAADLNTGAARTALRKAVLAARNGDPDDAQVRHRPGHPARRGPGVHVGVPARPLPARQPRPAPAHPPAPAAVPRQRLRPRLRPVAALGPPGRAAPLRPDPPPLFRCGTGSPNPASTQSSSAGPTTGTPCGSRSRSTCW